MMNSLFHMPVLILVSLLAYSIIIVSFLKHFGVKHKNSILIFLIILTIMSFMSLLYVSNNGDYTYNFSGWDSKIGIEFKVDIFSSFMVFFILGLSSLICLYSIRYIEHEINYRGFKSYYSLFLLLIFAMIGMTYSNDLFNIYVFMEILSLTSCGIISIKSEKDTLLSSFRYLMLGTIGSVTILLGIAFMYMATGYLNITEINNIMPEVWSNYQVNIILSIGFMSIGLGIKAAVFPLHTWLPDAHASAPAPSSALLSALVVKVYIFFIIKIIYRMIGTEIFVDILGINTYVMYFGALGMVMGSIFAIGQKDIKRLLAYSSVAQIGYIFLTIGISTEASLTAGMYHIVSHALMKSALFLSVGAIMYKTGKRKIADMQGIGFEMPFTMIVFSIGALGMIGIPGISGFMSKWYIALSVLEADKPILLFVILLSSFLNAVYYLPIIINGFLKPKFDGTENMTRDGIPDSMSYAMFIVAGLSIYIGLFPQRLWDVAQKAVESFL